MDRNEKDRCGEPECKPDGELLAKEYGCSNRKAARGAQEVGGRYKCRDGSRRRERPKGRKCNAYRERQGMAAPPYDAGKDAASDERSTKGDTTG